jgi:hypothetical protein
MTVQATFRLGDKGTVITLNFRRETSPGVFAYVNVAAATTRTAHLIAPSGTVTDRSCTAGVENYQICFTLGEDDFDEVGTWRIIGFVENATFSWHSDPVEVQVKAVEE